MMMNHTGIIKQLALNKQVIYHQLYGQPAESCLFKPSPEKWCMLEVICHLVDEEQEDFRPRVQYVLKDPNQELPKFNPLERIESGQYLQQDLEGKAMEFVEERTRSIDWLESPENPAWSNTYQHPTLGPMSAGLFLANWLAHDYIHIRQLNRLAYEYHHQQSSIDLSYAGNW